ncbi:hypothetical protein ALC57_12310 [Trachymyrmex cornetzi]|uniref:Beta-ketoacyl synthase-like N-terminal domain-containing protein n=1 Tax=Trachymyrmex cornetzi TaxID=471704 RepID=A0A151K3G4_9HYME|nr:hypothetical protein ALC57_12310 [Trachymyrmex cornetzi]
MLLEHSYEAILDAGINPKQLQGKDTAVIIGISVIDAQEKFLYEDFQVKEIIEQFLRKSDKMGFFNCLKFLLRDIRIHHFK